MRDDEVPAGAVTTADLYRKLESISDSLIRVDERIKVLPDMEARIRLLEKFRFTLMGAAAMTGLTSGVLSGILSVVLSRR